MREQEKINPFGTEIEQIKYWDESYGYLNISPALKILGIDQSDYESLKRLGFFTPHYGYGPTEGNRGGSKKIESTYIKPSELLRYAAIVYEKKNNPNLEWRELVHTSRSYMITYSRRLALLESKYWSRLKNRALRKNIDLDNYPSMNMRLVKMKVQQ